MIHLFLIALFNSRAYQFNHEVERETINVFPQHSDFVPLAFGH